jgi:hypothetical protein
MFRFATWSGTPAIELPNGITIRPSAGGTRTISGAMTKIGLSASSGMMSSLKMNLIASASGWARPPGSRPPSRFSSGKSTRSGPMRPCMKALRRRSTITISGVRPKTKNPRTNAIFRTSGSPIGLHTQVADLSVVVAGHRLAEHAFDRGHRGPGAERDERLLQPLRLGSRRTGGSTALRIR